MLPLGAYTLYTLYTLCCSWPWSLKAPHPDAVTALERVDLSVRCVCLCGLSIRTKVCGGACTAGLRPCTLYPKPSRTGAAGTVALSCDPWRAAIGAVAIAAVGVVGVFKLALWVADSAGRQAPSPPPRSTPCPMSLAMPFRGVGALPKWQCRDYATSVHAFESTSLIINMVSDKQGIQYSGMIAGLLDWLLQYNYNCFFKQGSHWVASCFVSLHRGSL